MQYVFIFIAGLVNSFMDRITFNEEGSIFHKYDLSPFQTYDKEKKFLGIVQFDAWHIAKYFMLFFFFLAAVTRVDYFKLPFILGALLDIQLCFIAWMGGFETGWKLFKRR